MASESSVADQSIDEHAEEEKVGDVSKCVDGEEIIFQPKEAAGKGEADNSKEVGLTGMASTASFSEENLAPDDLSIADVTKKEEQHEKVEAVENSPRNSEVSNSSEPIVQIQIDERNLQSEADDAHEMPSEVQEKSSDFIETSASQEPAISESKSEDLEDTERKPTFENERKPEEAPVVSTGVDIESANPAFSKDKAGIELIGSEDSNDEIQVLVPAEIPTVFVPDSSETPENNVDSANLASIEVPVKDLEAVSGSPEEQKSKESTEIKETISNVSINDAGDEVGSSSYEVKPAGVSEVVENKYDGLEVETTQPSCKIQEDLEANRELAQTESDENVSQGVEVRKDDEIVEGGIETSTVPDDVPPLAKVSSEEEKASEPSVVVEEEGESSLESDNIDTVHKVAEISLEDENVVEEDELVDKEKIVSTDAVERDLVDSIIDPTEANVSSEQVKTPITENVDEALEVPFKDLNIAPIASEAFSESDQIPAGEEKSDSLKGEAATSVATPEDITTPGEPLDQLIEEKKSESSASETCSPSEDKLLEEEKDANEEAKDINLQSQANGVDQIPSVVGSDFKSASEEPAFSKSKTEDLKDTEIKPTSENERKPEEAPLVSTGVGISKDENIEAETKDAANTEFRKDKDDIKTIQLEDSKDEIHVLAPAEIPTVVHDSYEAPVKNDIDSSSLTTIEMPVKNLEVESGSPEEQKPNESKETKEPSSDFGALDAEGEVVGSSFYEAKPSGIAEVIEKKNNGLEAEKEQSSVGIHEDLEAKPELVQTQSDENVSEGVKVNDEIVEGGIEISTVPDDIPLPSEVSFKEEKASEPVVVFEEEEETSLEGDNIGSVPKVAEVSLEGGKVLEGDKLVDKEDVNAEAVERELVNTITDPAEAEVSSDQVKAPTTTEIENEAPEVTSKEVSVAPAASEVPFEGDKISTGDEKSEILKGETSTSVEAPNAITTVEEPLDQVIEEKKSESSISDTQATCEDKVVDKEKDVNEEGKETNLQSQADGADQNLSVQSDSAETSTSQESVFLESKNIDLKDTETKPTSENEGTKPTSENEGIPVEAPLVSTDMDISDDENLEAETEEAANPELSKDKVDMELLKSEDSKDEIQVSAPAEIPTVAAPYAFEAPEKNDVDSTYPTNIEVPVKDLEVESGLPEEHKPKESTETKEPSSSVSTIDAGGEVVGSSYEAKPSGNAVFERKDDGLEIHENLEANPQLAQTQSDENVSEVVQVKKDDETVEGGMETSNVSDYVPPLAKVSYEKEKAVEPGLVVEEDKISLEGDNIGTVANVSLKDAHVLDGDKLVDKDKILNSDDVETDLVGTFTDPTDAEVSSDQVKAPTTSDIVKEESDEGALEMTSKELNIAPEASEFPSEVDTFSTGDEKSECLKVGDATSVEVPKDIIAIKDSLDQLFEEKKSESSASEMVAQTEDILVDKAENVNVEDEGGELINTSTDATAAEVSSEKVKAPELLEEVSNKQALEETSKELNIAPEASEFTSEDDKLSAVEEKSESLKGEAATLAEAPEDIITIKESHDQAIDEKKSESSISERGDPTEDKLLDKEKKVNEKSEERDSVDTSIGSTAAEVSSDQTKASETAEIMKEESNKQALEVTSKELNISSEASEVPFIGDEVSASDEVKSESSKGEDATLVEAPKNIQVAEDAPDQVIMQKKSEVIMQKKSEGSKSEMEALAEDKLVDKEKDMNEEAEKTESVDIPTDPSAAVGFSEPVKVAETDEINESDKETLDLASKELNIVPEASEVPSEGYKVSSGEEEKSESLKDEEAASLESRKDITIEENPFDQLSVETKSESLENEKEAPIETTRDFDASMLLPKAVKDIIASETVQEKQDATSNDLSMGEKKSNDSEYKKEEVKVEEALQNATDKAGQAELRTENAASETSKDENPIVSSDSGDAKLTKEASKRESSIFSKVKRSIVKAKKAILRKSPGPKTLSSEAKDGNT